MRDVVFKQCDMTTNCAINGVMYRSVLTCYLPTYLLTYLLPSIETMSGLFRLNVCRVHWLSSSGLKKLMVGCFEDVENVIISRLCMDSNSKVLMELRAVPLENEYLNILCK